MINIKRLSNILKSYNIDDVEKGLISFYVQEKDLNFLKSDFLNDYLYDFNFDESLKNEIVGIGINSFSHLEHTLELLIPKTDKELNGAFFTPTIIVDEIINEVSPQESDKCIDPSCGCGAFLLGIIRYFQKNYQKSIKDTVKENIFGADILSYNSLRAKILIGIYALEHDEIIEDSDINIITIDSLRHNWEENFDIVIGNPPYVKFQDLSDENRNFLKEHWQTIEKGTFNLYFAFFELGYKLLNERGKLGYITPNNYFTSLSGESLRKFFEYNRCVFRITDFNHYKVFNAQTYTCLTFLNKQRNNKIRFTKMFNDNLIHFLEKEKESTVEVNGLNSKKWRLQRDSDHGNIRKIENLGRRLNSLFIINVGIATLKDQLYFIDQKRNGKLFKLVEGKEFEIEKELTCTIFKISDFSSQSEIEKNQRRIIFPYDRVNGKIIPLSEVELSLKYPKGYMYLQHIKDLLDKRGKDVLDPFYIYGRSQGLNKTGIRLLTPTFSQYPKFLFVDDLNSLYCNGYGLHYKDDFGAPNELFDVCPIQDKNYIDVLQRILNSYIMHYYVSHTSVSIQGGYPCYQKNFIELFSIPDLSEKQLNDIRGLDNLELDVYLINIYNLQGLLPNLKTYWRSRFGTTDSNVRLAIEALDSEGRYPSSSKSLSEL